MGKAKRTKHVLIELLILLAGVSVLWLVLTGIGLSSSTSRQKEDNETELNLIVNKIQTSDAAETDNIEAYDTSCEADGKLIIEYLNGHQNGEEQLSGLASEFDLNGYVLLNSDGTFLQSSNLSMNDHAEEMQKLISDGEPVTIDSTRYYSVHTNKGETLLYSYDYTKEQDTLDQYYSLKTILSNLNAGNTGTVTAVSLKDGTVLYSDDDSLIGQKTSDLGYSNDLLKDGFNGKTEISSQNVYASVKKTGNTLLIASKNYSSLYERSRLTISLILLVFAVIIGLIILYSNFINKDTEKHPEHTGEQIHIKGRWFYNAGTGNKIRIVALVGIAAVFLMTYYLETLGPLSRQGTLSEERLSAVREILERDDSITDAIKTEYSTQYTQRAQHIAYMLSLDPDMVNHDELVTLKNAGNLKSIYVFDSEGRASAMSTDYRRFELSSDKDSQSYAFWDVVNGSEAVYVQDAGYDDLGDYVQLIGVQREDADGMVQVGIEPSRLEKRLKTDGLNQTLNSINIGQDGFLLAVSKKIECITAYPESSTLGKSASSLGIASASLQDSYSGFQTIDGIPYFLNGFLYNDSDYVYAAIPLSVMYSGRLLISAEVTLISAVIIFLIFLFLTVAEEKQAVTVKDEKETDWETEEEKEASFFRHLRFSGHKAWTQSASSRYGDTVLWKEKNPEQKLWAVVLYAMAAAAVLVTLYVQIFRTQAMNNNIIHYIVNQKWEKGINLFSLTYSVFAMMDIVTVTWLIRTALLYILSRFGSRSETVGHLLNSFLKYASVIGGIFYCLNLFGLDTNTLLASAGILSVIIGLGAQSLISDVLAGISIVFEGSFRVGDIVTIDSWRGEVVEIGIRTTKVRSIGNDIRIFNNSKISSVINMTKQYSYAILDIGVEYNESLEHIESVLKEELPKIHSRIPAIVNGPYYKGVTSLGESCVNLRILAQCSEADRVQVTRDLNREILLVFNRNHINIPYPQIVVNAPTAAVKATRHDRAAAESFVSEQKEQSKDIHTD